MVGKYYCRLEIRLDNNDNLHDGLVARYSHFFLFYYTWLYVKKGNNVVKKRIHTEYVGIFYRIASRIGGKGEEKIFYAVYKKDGKTIETKIGRQYADQMTAAKASRIRAEMIEGRRETRKKIRENASESKNEIHWTLARLWDEYKLRNPDLKGMCTDQNRFQVHLQILANKKITEITTENVDSIRLQLKKDGKKDGTIKNVLELLRRIISFGVKKGLIEAQSPTRLRFEMPRLNNQKTEDLTPPQLESLLQAIYNNRHKPVAQMMELAIYTGMRRSEILHLKWSDINFERGYIYIRGENDSQVGAKSGLEEKIPLNDHTREILQRLEQTISPYVFPSRTGKPYVDVRRQANAIKKEAGLPDDFRAFHGLRHTFASLLASSGQVSMYELQKLLTHKSQAMTQRYAHLHDDALKNASNVIGSAIKQAYEKNE